MNKAWYTLLNALCIFIIIQGDSHIVEAVFILIAELLVFKQASDFLK